MILFFMRIISDSFSFYVPEQSKITKFKFWSTFEAIK